jgi:RDD family protein
MYAAAIVAAIIGGIGNAFWIVLFFLLEWFYPVFFELTPSGTTPGKRAFGLRVVMDNGLPITPAASMTRNLLRVADFLPFGYGFAIVSLLLRADCKRLGDIAAATLVIHEPEAVPRITLDDVVPLAPVRPLAPEDQAAVVALAARAPRLTVERLDELAALAATVSGDAGRGGPDVTRRVLGVAQWLLGRRA